MEGQETDPGGLGWSPGDAAAAELKQQSEEHRLIGDSQGVVRGGEGARWRFKGSGPGITA